MGPLAHVQGFRCRDKMRYYTVHACEWSPIILTVSGYTLANLAYNDILGVV